MKRLVTTLALLVVCAGTASAANQMRISQVYGGGGGTTGVYTRDFVELYNSGVTPVNIGGWTIQYGSATGAWGSSTGNIFTFPVGTTVQPCQYILIECGAAGTGGVALSPAADFQTGLTAFSMSATGGKVALFNAVNSNVLCGSEIAGTLVDKVAYGTANCAEGTAVSGISTAVAMIRNSGGNTDTDNNSVDFATGTPTPRNSSSTNAACSATPTTRSTWGSVKAIYR